jgi:hypothetical protein
MRGELPEIRLVARRDHTSIAITPKIAEITPCSNPEKPGEGKADL